MNTDNPVNIVELQDKILEIATYMDEFCKAHDITYYLMGGSALGSVRHQGFIPWDDDFDVFMTHDNYFKFIEVCKKQLDTEQYYLQQEDTEEWPLFFTKLRMNGTTFFEKDVKNRDMHRGIYIDVMCLNNASSNGFYRYFQYACARMITASTLKKRGYSSTSLKKKILMNIAAVIVPNPVKRWLLSIVRSKNNTPTEYVGHYFGRANYKNTTFPRNYLGTARYLPFSTASLPVPEQVEKYLTLRYGDYAEIPSEGTKRDYPIHAEFVDTKVDYRDHLNKLS